MDEDLTNNEMFELLEAAYYMDNLNEEMDITTNEPYPEVIDDLNDVNQLENVPMQIGGAPQLDPTDYFELYDRYDYKNVPLRTTVYGSKIRFKNLDTIPLAHLPRALENIMDRVIEASSDGASVFDYIRFFMNSDALTDPVNMPFMMRTELTGKQLLNYISRIQQSKAEFDLEGPGFCLTVFVTKFPSPGGHLGKGCKKRVTINLIKWMTYNKRCAIAITSEDNLCLSRALVVAKAYLQHANDEINQKQLKAVRDGRRPVQLKAAVELHRDANVVRGLCGLLEVEKFQRVFSNSGISIVIIDASTNFNVVYRGPAQHKKHVFLLLANEHFTPITNISAFYGREKYCVLCMKPTSRKHNCTPHCTACLSADCGEYITKSLRNIRCDKCNRYFYGAICMQTHIQNKTCDNVKACPTCYQLEKNHKECFTHKCDYCNRNVESSHLCYIQTEAIGARNNNNRDPVYWYYDFETMRRADGVHIANLVVVQRGYDGEEYIFRGAKARDSFCEWIFDSIAKETKFQQTFIAHYAKGYDSHLVMEWLYQHHRYPDVIWTGNKIMCADVGNVRFIDSFNFLPMPLVALPATFNLVELKKGYFPHLFNTPENQSYVGPLPALQYYEPDLKRARDRASLIEWHRQQSALSLPFDLQTELLEYCISDVQILRRACENFRQLGLSLFKSDPFNGCITIAAYCLKVYRGLYMPADTIGIIPAGGYRGGRQRYSNMAVKWIMWSEQQAGVHIQHARNGGEVCIDKYKVDGLDLENRVIYEFYGCFYHGCDKCYRDNAYNPVTHCVMSVLRHQTFDRQRKLEEMGFTFNTMWECKFKELLETDGLMKEFVESVVLEEALDPKDAFFGGRTSPTTLYYKANEHEVIRYCDYVSLYPTVNKYDRMPAGHPKILISVNEPYEVGKYFGIIKCTVIPPRKLYHPVLPYRSKGKLLFPLCRTCAEVRNDTRCEHDDQHRGWTGTWTTVEVDLAVENGYTISKVHEVWHYPKTIQFKVDEERGLFSEYVNTLLRLKQEASGYPSWVKTREDEIKFSLDYLQKEGITLGKIEKNPGKRALAKLMLNSLWGKFAQREDLAKTVYVDNFNDLRNLLTDEKKVVTDAYMINEKMMMATYVETAETIAPSGRTSVVIAAFTTACARIRLYMLLNRLGESVLYMDTDSVIFVSDKNTNPLSDLMGERLGQLTDEIEGEYGPEVFIKEFVSGGPKNYGYLLSNGASKWKVKGITANHRTETVINYEVIRNMVSEPTTVPETVSVPVSQVRRDKTTCALQSFCGVKRYRLIFDKGVVMPFNYKVYPYGYIH